MAQMDEGPRAAARNAFLVGYALATGQARSGHAEGDVEAARGALLTAITAGDPEWSPRASYVLGDFLLQQGDASGAQRALSVALDAGHPEWTPGAQVVAGVLAAAGGDRIAAEAQYRAAIGSGHPQHTHRTPGSISGHSISRPARSMPPSRPTARRWLTLSRRCEPKRL